MELQTPQVFAVGSPLEAVRGLRSGTFPVSHHLQRQVGALTEYEGPFGELPYESFEGATAQHDLAVPWQPVAPRAKAARVTKLRPPSVAQLRRKLMAAEDKKPIAEHSAEAPVLPIMPPTSVQYGRRPFVRQRHRTDTVASDSSQTSLVSENSVELGDEILEFTPNSQLCESNGTDMSSYPQLPVLHGVMKHQLP